jgi:hypothetical protein
LRGDGILELLTHLPAANLDGMHVETPIRAGHALGKVLPPLSRKSMDPREDSVVHDWDHQSQLSESSSRASNGHGTDREERLLRLVDILRTEQVSASVVAKAEVARTGLHRWRGPFLLAVVVILMGAAVLLCPSRPTHVFSDARPDLVPERGHPIQSNLTTKIGLQPHSRDGTGDTSVATNKPFNPSLIAPFPEGLAQGNPVQSSPAIEQQVTNRSGIAEAATSPAARITETKPVDLAAPKQEADSLARPPSAAMTDDISGSEPNKPALVVYYPRGSLRAKKNAQSLSARIQSDLTKSDFEAQSALPDDAVIKFSEESNHALARRIGKSLGDLGYRWRIENSPRPVGAPRNSIEVWLPR